MTEIHNRIPRPRGLSRRLFKLPVYLYHLHLGSLLGNRFLLLHHQGRKSHQLYQAVIEVVKHDELSHTFYVVSGWGEKADWYQNIMAHPQVLIQVKDRIRYAIAERTSALVGENVIVSYYHHHPLFFRELSRVMGYPFNGTEESVRTFGRSFPVVAFHVQEA
jgi:deazaflavin-dependent oxidoreductase (nitroreductase family)